MPKFSIAFTALTDKNPLRHQVLDAPDQEAALKEFFGKELLDLYSDDEQGYFYFKEDFADRSNRCGSVIQVA